MADFGELLGYLMSSFARAREIADHETAAIAERYKSNPLLEGLSVPRIRIPDLTIDLPLLIESEQAGSDAVMEKPAKISRELEKTFAESATRNGVTLTPEMKKSFATAVSATVGGVGGISRDASIKETLSRGVDIAVKDTLKAVEGQRIDPVAMKKISADLRRKAADVAVITPARPSGINAVIATAEVKEKSAPGNVTRLRLSLREEGVEWSIVTDEDGATAHRLSPE